MSRKQKKPLRGLRKLANERDVKRAALNVFNLVLRGEVTPSQGSTMNGSLGVARAAIGTEVEREALERLEKLERELEARGGRVPESDEPSESPRPPLSLVKSAK